MLSLVVNIAPQPLTLFRWQALISVKLRVKLCLNTAFRDSMYLSFHACHALSTCAIGCL
jgi:hypothetical protein